MAERTAELERNTKETRIKASLNLDGRGDTDIATGIPFLDHMLALMAAHGFMDLEITARGDIEVDYHHTVEDLGIVLGEALDRALGDRRGIRRFGHAVTPMDDALAEVTVDLSNRPFLVCRLPEGMEPAGQFPPHLVREFCRAMATRGGMNLHINVHYGDDPHHIIESVYKSIGRALAQATGVDARIKGVRSTKGAI
jgi:imidazoleglycerol-phosphate dehydratase